MNNQFSDFDQRYADLNPEQKRAVDTIDGPVLVIAGPGSGKTELLSLRVANILRSTDTEASSILCLTFTDAAAANMRRRLSGLIGPEAYKVGIYTFHSYATSIINRYPEYFYKGVRFNAADDLRQRLNLIQILDSLPHDHSLKVTNKDGYQYVDAIRSSVAHLKKSGLSPQNFKAILEQNKLALEKINPLLLPFEQTMTNKAIDPVQDVLLAMLTLAAQFEAINGVPPLALSVARQLEEAVKECQLLDKATPLSDWKKNMTYKDEQGRRVLKDTRYIDKQLALAEVYALYQQKMQADNFYDYDDMLLDVLEAVNKSNELRYALQESAQYVLVDEFQDTNDAQMQLIHLLSSGELQGNTPNLMVVGDDDQAIYKFQGAEVGYMQNLKHHYADLTQIVLTENYRSTQAILDVARQVIVQGKHRLENYDPDIRKELKAANKTLADGQVVLHEYATADHELQGVARQVRQLLDNGVPAKEVAVIARRHQDLQMVVAYLQGQAVPILYERQQDVLQEPLVHQLIQMTRFAVTVARKGRTEADDLLPEILSYPFWQLDRLAVWRVSVAADKQHRLWLEVMLDSDDQALCELAAFLIHIGELSQTEPIDRLLEVMMGAHQPQLPDGDSDEMEESVEVGVNGWVSPFKEYYFGPRRFDGQRSQYVRTLSALKTFVGALHEHQPDRLMMAEDLLRFVDDHQSANLPLTNTSPFVSGEQAVSLLTAHGAKGLEFDSVFVLHVQNDIWGSDRHGGGLVSPTNVPLSTMASESDDFLRLFYVAITRARRNLFMSSYRQKSDGKESVRLSFVADHEGQKIDSQLEEAATLLETSWHQAYRPPIADDEQVLLLPLVEQYKMSVTHFNNFLNVTKGGPQLFLEQNLLRFPQPKVAATAYGSAVHEALGEFLNQFKHDGVLPESDVLLTTFERRLQQQWLPTKDHQHFLAKGRDELQSYYDAKSSDFSLTDRVEENFTDQQVMVGAAQLTGKIDRIVQLGDGQVSVHDMKTGSPSTSWRGDSDYRKVKLHHYRTQLQFYKLLVEESRGYAGKLRVESGMLEFLQPYNGRFVELPLPESDFAEEAMDRLKQLIAVVFDHIQQLNFPETDDYPQTLEGIEQFEQELLEGKI